MKRFTLIDVMIVVVIIALLAVMAIPAFKQAHDRIHASSTN